MAEADLVGPGHSLERENEKLRKIADALMRRVERDTAQSGNAYSLFQRSIALEAEIRARTEDLQRTLAELQTVNEQLKSARAEAEAANRAKSRFLAAASHDLLQPLNAAKLFLSSLGETPLSTAAEQITVNLSSSLNSLEALMNALLEISKLDSPHIDAQHSTLDLGAVMEPIIREFGPIAATAGSRLRYVPTACRVVSDPTYLRQIVQNLVSNAVRYGAGGKVLVGCRRRGEYLRIDVCDQGPGIPPDRMQEIFMEFRRLGQSRGTKTEGMGLGLAIVERACRLLGHEIGVSSVPGRGSRFSVTLPVAENQRAPKTGPQALENSLVLVATTDTALAESLAQLIEPWGPSLLSVSGEDEAVEMICQLGMSPDLLLMDMASLGAAPAEELGATLRALFDPGLRVVHVVEGGEQAEDRNGLAGPSATIAKPIRPHRLRALLSWQPQNPG